MFKALIIGVKVLQKEVEMKKNNTRRLYIKNYRHKKYKHILLRHYYLGISYMFYFRSMYWKHIICLSYDYTYICAYTRLLFCTDIVTVSTVRNTW